MKKNSISRVVILFAAALMPFCAFAQVKQVFQILHFETKQPIQGAKTQLYVGPQNEKQTVFTLTTNAQGVAVANLPADMKGSYLAMDGWKLDGFLSLGRTPECAYSYFQTKDTIKYYMVEKQTYRKEKLDVFEQIFRYHYLEDMVSVSQMFRDTVKAHPELTKTHVNQLIEASFDNVNTVSNCYEDAASVNKYDFTYYNEPQYSEVLSLLRTGNVNKAVEIVKSHIDLTDNSYNNMKWIDLYRVIMMLDYAPEEEEPMSTYSEVLYRNHYSPRAAVWYINDLERNSEYAKADSIIRLEKPNNKDPRSACNFIPSFVQYLDGSDNAKLKSVSEELLQVSLNTYKQYPDQSNLFEIFWVYKNLYYTYVVLDDSVSATRTIDSAMAVTQRYIAPFIDDYSKNQQIVKMMQNLLTVVTVDSRYISDTLLYQIYDDMYNAAKANYDQDTTNLFMQLQLAECALRWLKESPEPEDNEEKHTAVLEQLVNLEFKLSKEFPEYYPLQNVQVVSQLLAQRLMNPSSNEQIQDAFRQYERSFDEVNARFPKSFIDHYLRFNSLIESFLTANQQFILTSELSAFTDHLLNIKADNDPQKFLVLKAENANEMAENLYQDEMYEESIAYYLQSNEYYEKAIPQDEQLWIPYLTNYLQMGDAHLYQNQFDKAMLTYQKILDFEPQIPASVLPKYMQQKGSVYYYRGDVYRATEDLKRAEKEYKTAEKYYKKSVAMGNNEAYQQLGEMYWGKAVVASQQDDMKKCRQMVEQSVAYYDAAPADRPLQTYERAKSVMAEFYKQEGNAEKYYETVADLTDYYRKYANYSLDYATKLVQNAETMVNSGTISNEEVLTYSHDILSGLLNLYDAGEEVDLPYMRGLFNLARAYTANDSVSEAIKLYRDCLTMNEVMFKDTAVETYKNNLVEIYSKMATCYELMAEEIDTAHSELWYYRAIDTRDTMLDVLKDLSGDGNVNMTYRTAVQYKNNAVIFYELDMLPSAQDYMDKSIEQLQMLYNSEYKTEIEEDLILHYYLKGVMYEEKGNDDEKAVEFFRKAVEIGENADTSEGVSRYYFMAVNELIEQLSKDAASNAKELAKLTKTQKALKKLF